GAARAWWDVDWLAGNRGQNSTRAPGRSDPRRRLQRRAGGPEPNRAQRILLWLFQRGDLAAVSRSAEFLQLRTGVLAGLQASKRTVCGRDPAQRTTGRFHLGPRLSLNVRCPGTAGTEHFSKSVGAHIFPAHTISAVRHF